MTRRSQSINLREPERVFRLPTIDGRALGARATCPHAGGAPARPGLRLFTTDRTQALHHSRRLSIPRYAALFETRRAMSQPLAHWEHVDLILRTGPKDRRHIRD